MKEIDYVPVDRIMSKVSRDIGLESLPIKDCIEWTGEAMQAIGAITLLQEHVSFIEVKDYSCTMPTNLEAIIQISRNNLWDTEKYDCVEDVVQDNLVDPTCTCPEYDDNCDCGNYNYIPVDETGTPIFDSDLYEWKPTIWVPADYVGVFGNTEFKRKWSVVRLASNSFFNADDVVCEVGSNNSIYTDSKACGDEYQIALGRKLTFSFEEGYVAIAYLGSVVDSNGYPMVPDHYSYTTAVSKYITMKMMERMWYMGRENYKEKVMKSEADWNTYCKQAANRAMMPRGIDDFQDLLDQGQYLLPRMHRYYNFFSEQNRPEKRRFNDPDLRNNYGRLY